MTHGYMLQLWRKAVRIKKGERCCNPECGNMASGCHHLIKVRYRTTAYRAENGIPLCAICHPIADRSPQFALGMISEIDYNFIKQRSIYNLQEWLTINHMSREEFLKSEADELKRIIKGE